MRSRSLAAVKYLENIKSIISELYLIENLISAFEMIRKINNSMYILAWKLKYRRISSVIDFKNYTRYNLGLDMQLEDD